MDFSEIVHLSSQFMDLGRDLGKLVEHLLRRYAPFKNGDFTVNHVKMCNGVALSYQLESEPNHKLLRMELAVEEEGSTLLVEADCQYVRTINRGSMKISRLVRSYTRAGHFTLHCSDLDHPILWPATPNTTGMS